MIPAVDIEKRKLPENFRYVIVQFTGIPLHALLWFVCLWWSLAVALGMKSIGPHYSFQINGASILLFLLGAHYVSDIIYALCRKSGRAWLLTPFRDENIKPAGSVARFFVRIVPVIAIFAVLSYWF